MDNETGIMMRKIFKYPLVITDYQTIEVKNPAILLSVVAEQDDKIMMYAMVDDLEFGILIDIRIIGTGSPITDDIDSYKFLGTVKLPNGRLFHVFARYPMDFNRTGEKQKEDIPVLRIDEFINIKSPEVIA